MKKIIPYTVIFGALVAVGAYLYIQRAPQKQIEKPIAQLKVVWADAPSNRLIMSVLKANGFDKKHNLDLDIVWADPGENLRILLNKVDGIEVGSFPALSLIAANKQGKMLRSFAPLNYGGGDVVVKFDSRFTTIKDLKGSKIAIRPKNTAAFQNLDLGMRLVGVDLEKDFKLTFGSVADNIKEFTSGEVDASLLSALSAIDIRASSRFKVIAKLDEIWRDQTGSQMAFATIAAYEDWINSHREEMENLRAAYLETTNYIINNPRALDEYKDLLQIKTQPGMLLAEKDLVRSLPTKWNANEHRLTVKKAIEFGINENFSYENLFIE